MSSMTRIRYNIVQNDGEFSSVTVFLTNEMGKVESFVATREHTNAQAIVDALVGGVEDHDTIRNLFDVSAPLVGKFERLSERVTVNKGHLFFDGDTVDDALAQTIIRFHAEGNEDFKPLVAFLEKIQTNPQEHSKLHLFRWLRDKKIGICPDGDFIAYKGLDHQEMSIHSGTAMVNGTVIRGKIPNKKDTVIEMPRSAVTFDPKNGCSTGLHAGNWSYARSFAQGKVVIVKINPRDVVSVPVDSNDEKLRVCRYRVLREAQMEDRGALFVPDVEKLAKVVTKPEVVVPTPEPEKPVKAGKKARATAPAKKKAPAKKAAAKVVEETWPTHYELFKKANWDRLGYDELKWVAKEWEVPVKGNRSVITANLQKAARSRLRTWK